MKLNFYPGKQILTKNLRMLTPELTLPLSKMCKRVSIMGTLLQLQIHI